jgi:hypothetical protein
LKTLGLITHVFALTLLCVAGCVGPARGWGQPSFSPDGEQVCYIREDSIEEKVVDGKTWCHSVYLHWCNVNNPGGSRSIHIGWFGWNVGCPNVPVKVKWSPDGRRIGVWTPHQVTLVDVRSGVKKVLQDGIITGFAWRPDGGLSYLTHRIDGETQVIVVCLTDSGCNQRSDIFTFPQRPTTADWAAGHWSPSGERLVVMDPGRSQRFHCIRTGDGTTRSFGQEGARDAGVAWTPDSSRAFCVSRKIGPRGDYQAFLLDAANDSIVDCTSGFQSTFAQHRPSIESAWTVDGRYVIANALDVGGYLIQPSPWQALPLGQIAAMRIPQAKHQKNTNPWLFRLPIAGWVGVVPTGNFGDSPVLYASDYTGQRLVPLPEGCSGAVYRGGPGSASISRDGTKIATTSGDGVVSIRSAAGSWQLPVPTE